MIPTNFEQSNVVFTPPDGTSEDEVRSVFGYVGKNTAGQDVSVICWQLEKEEIVHLLETGRVYATTLGKPSPQWLSVLSPFGSDEGTELQSLKERIHSVLDAAYAGDVVRTQELMRDLGHSVDYQFEQYRAENN